MGGFGGVWDFAKWRKAPDPSRRHAPTCLRTERAGSARKHADSGCLNGRFGTWQKCRRDLAQALRFKPSGHQLGTQSQRSQSEREVQRQVKGKSRLKPKDQVAKSALGVLAAQARFAEFDTPRLSILPWESPLTQIKTCFGHTSCSGETPAARRNPIKNVCTLLEASLAFIKGVKLRNPQPQQKAKEGSRRAFLPLTKSPTQNCFRKSAASFG